MDKKKKALLITAGIAAVLLAAALTGMNTA